MGNGREDSRESGEAQEAQDQRKHSEPAQRNRVARAGACAMAKRLRRSPMGDFIDSMTGLNCLRKRPRGDLCHRAITPASSRFDSPACNRIRLNHRR